MVVKVSIKGSRGSNSKKPKLLMALGITIIFISLIPISIGITQYFEWDEKRQFWEEQKDQIYFEWQKNPENEGEKEDFLVMASAASHAKEKAKEYLWIFFFGVFLFFTGLTLFLYSTRDEILNLFKDPRMPTTIKFTMAIISIVCGIFSISMIFYQFTSAGYYKSLDEHNNTESTTFQSEIFHPEIFIPEGFILIMLGSVLLYILRRQVSNEGKSKRMNSISLGFSICILLFIALFVFGFIVLSVFVDTYTLLDPLFGIITAPLIFCASIYIIRYVNKIQLDETNNSLERDERGQIELVKMYEKYYTDLTIPTICILVFFAFFLSGFIIPFNYIYQSFVFAPIWGLIMAIFLIFTLAYLPFHVVITIKNSKLFRNNYKIQIGNENVSRRLLDNKTLNFNVITVILITLAFVCLLMLFTLGGVSNTGASSGLNAKMWDLATTFYIAWLIVSIFYLRNEQKQWIETRKDLQIFSRIPNLDPNKSELRSP